MNFTSVETLLQKLIDTPSVTGTEAELGTFLAEYLADQGFEVTKVPVDETRSNILATLGTPRVILQAHMDVVPPHIPASQDENFIYGRGSCDTKGSIASMIIAAQEAKTRGLTNFGVLFTVDEEVGFAGALALRKNTTLSDAFFIVGEPTNLIPVTAHFGILTFSVVCHGKTAHSSEPQLGINAIDRLVEVLSGPVQALRLHDETLMSVVRIQGGLADNVIPDRAEAVLSFRISPHDTIEYAKELEKLVGEKATIENVRFLPPVASSIPESLAFLGTGKQVKYCTELNFFGNGIVLGPGSITDAHTPTEKVAKAELQQAVETYGKILTNLTQTP